MKTPNINTFNSQAESMIVAAMQNGKNFERNATAFFRTANESGQRGNAIIAYYSKANQIAQNLPMKEKLKIFFGMKDSLIDVITEKIEKAANSNEELNKELENFVDIVGSSTKEGYARSYKDRASLLHHGSVRADEVHKPTLYERCIVRLSKMYRNYVDSVNSFE